MRRMASDLERALKGLDDARAFAAAYWFEVTDAYRALILQVEALPRNQPGTDKSGRWLGSRADQEALRARTTVGPRGR